MLLGFSSKSSVFMDRYTIPLDLSVIVTIPSGWQETSGLSDCDSNAILTVGVTGAQHSLCFRDLHNGTVLHINSDSTFTLHDSSGYTSGAVHAQQMQFEGYDMNIWHQDRRFTFTCNVNLATGFCFGWLIDRSFRKSWRILDPGIRV